METILRAKMLQLVDDANNVRAIFGINDADNSVGLTILHPNGQKSIEIALEAYKQDIDNLDPSLFNNVTVFSNATGQIDQSRLSTPVLRLYDNDDKLRLEARLNHETPQYPSIVLFDSHRRERITLAVTPNNDAEISMMDAKGEPCFHELF